MFVDQFVSDERGAARHSTPAALREYIYGWWLICDATSPVDSADNQANKTRLVVCPSPDDDDDDGSTQAENCSAHQMLRV